MRPPILLFCLHFRNCTLIYIIVNCSLFCKQIIRIAEKKQLYQNHVMVVQRAFKAEPGCFNDSLSNSDHCVFVKSYTFEGKKRTKCIYEHTHLRQIKTIDLLLKREGAKVRVRGCKGNGAIVVSLLRLRTSLYRLRNITIAPSPSQFALSPSHLRNFALSHLSPKGETAKVEVAPSEHRTALFIYLT